VTVQGIRELNACDLVLVPRKGAAKEELAELRREICGRYLDNPATRVVEFDLPVRDAAGPYRRGVEEWHRTIAETYRGLLAGEDGRRVGLLVWGDPSLYDSTLRVLGRLRGMGVVFEVSVVPGITSLQALAAGHKVALNEVGGEVRVLPGRRLREEGAPEGEATLVVVLDGDCAFRGLPAAEWEICWGAYLGMPEEMLIAGRLDEVGERIVAARAAARAAHGWIMDTYLLRRRG
jgi:precorrin-6A synthase